MGRGRFLMALGFCLIGITVLGLLGSWQVQRLAWKQDILERIDHRIHAAPIGLAELMALQARTGDVDYTPVTLAGRFLNDKERYFLSTYDGQAGWEVYTPFVVHVEADSRPAILFVNRGFVPYEMRDPSTRRAGEIEGETEVTGLARNAPTAKSNYFMPDNDPSKRTFFWRDLSAMSQGLDLPDQASVLPFFVDAGAGRAPGGWPVGGTTVIDIPNNHLQYAITWFGLALVLCVMTVALVVRHWRSVPEEVSKQP